MKANDTFDAEQLRFPASRGRVGGEVLLRVHVSTRPVGGWDAIVRASRRSDCERRMRRLLADNDVVRLVQRAYAPPAAENAWVRTRRSGIAGTGVFARRDVPKGTILEDVTRPLVRYDQVPQKGEPGYGHAIQIARGAWLLLGHSPFYFLNHRCGANVRLRIRGARVEVVATRRIRRGEELSLDYATVAFRDDPYAFECRCGARRCRGVVKGERV